MNGIGVCGGIGIANAFVLNNSMVDIERKIVLNTPKEKERLKKAIITSINQIQAIKEKIKYKVGKEKALIFDAHVMMLKDVEFVNKINKVIDFQNANAEYAVRSVSDEYIQIFESMEDKYMRERASDIKDVSERVIKNLLNIINNDLTRINEEIIIVSHDLTPSQTCMLDAEYVRGFITEIGGKTSHSAIIANTLGIPYISGVKGAINRINSGDLIVMDGESGDIFLKPNEIVVEEYREKITILEEEKRTLKSYIGKRTQTICNKRIGLMSNISSIDDVQKSIDNDCEGIGLFRTEFMYMNKAKEPSENEQFEIYKNILENMGKKPVIIRTLDIGGDKDIPYLTIKNESNPFLGVRGIRFCFENEKVFKTQLRALLRASVYGSLKIMFPMIATLDELVKAKRMFDESKLELDSRGIKYEDNIELGIMIEVPSAAILSDVLSRHVDFCSIGTNDLMQYTFAADRMNESVNYLNNPVDVAFLRLIKMVIQNFHENGKWVGICGEIAGDKNALPFLIEMGIDEISVCSSKILSVRKFINSYSCDKHKNILLEKGVI